MLPHSFLLRKGVLHEDHGNRPAVCRACGAGARMLAVGCGVCPRRRRLGFAAVHRQAGGVDINDCEAISRAVDPILDEKDPIPDSYSFEVCSAGLERVLKRPGDFEQFMGSMVLVRLYQPKDGKKEIVGTLAGYDDGAVTISLGSETVRFEKKEVALVRLYVEF